MKKKHLYILEALIVVLVMMIVGSAIIPKFLAAQNINTPENFPDPNFRAAVETFMGVEPGGVFTKTQAAENAGTLDFKEKDVSDLKGIEYLTSVTKIEVSGNNITSIDLSHHKSLEHLDISLNKLKQLDLSDCDKLWFLNCGGNGIEEITLPKSGSIKNVLLLRNRLDYIDLSYSPNILDFWCHSNQFKFLDFSNNPKIAQIFCNDNQLTSIDVSNNPALWRLRVRRNLLTDFPDLSNNPILGNVDISENYLDCDDMKDINTFKEKSKTIHNFHSFHYAEQKNLNLDDCEKQKTQNQ